MHLLEPDKRLRMLREAVVNKTSPLDPFLRRCYLHLTGEQLDEKVGRTMDLIDVPKDREVLMAFLISKATKEEIATSTWVEEELVEMFELLCFDPQAFRNKLEFIRYAKEYAATCTDYGRKLIDTALTVGPSYLIYMHALGREEIPLDADMFMRTLVQEAFHLGIVAKGNSITSAASKESFKWMRAAHELVAAYRNTKAPATAEDDAVFALQEGRQQHIPDPETELGQIIHQGSIEVATNADKN